MTNYLRLEAELRQITHLQTLASVIHWDAEMNLPSGATTNRHQEIATLSQVIQEKATSDVIKNLIAEAKQEIDKLNEFQKANLAIIERNYQHAKCISPELQNAHSIATNESEFVWREARKNNDFKKLIPYLDKVFALTREIANLKADFFQADPYDMLMAVYDTDRTTTETQTVFNVLKQNLPNLITKIVEKQRTERILPLTGKILVSKQREIGMNIIQKMGFEIEKGRLDIAAHPFCSGSNDDVRLTTRYDEYNFTIGLFGIIHETGHGLYQQNLPAAYRDQPIGMPKGMSFHESQSLIMECQAGTSWEFIQFLARTLRDDFALKDDAYFAENLYKLVTRVQPSFIRVEADEVTYPLHVILRFEIEQAIIKDNLQAADLPQVWNEKMQHYLGITPAKDSEGCMQDVHWPAGLIGYFPCYTNGAIIASMLMRAAQNQYPTIKDALAQGNFQNLNLYLNNKLRNLGSLKSFSELLKIGTGHETINPHIFIEYLTKKYL